MAKTSVKGDQKMEVNVNDYSFSQVGKGLAGGTGSESQVTKVPENLINGYSLSKCSDSNGLGKDGKSDNINEYSLSKLGRALG